MLEKFIVHLMDHPKEALAVVEGKASPIGLSGKEILEVIRVFNNDNVHMVAGFWT